MIPKIIHCCWFGRNPKPKLAEKCIRSWKTYCPDYEIIEWNEDNFDIAAAPLYVRQAYEAKKWAFVTDYVRLQVVYEYGGIYLDTDVELRAKTDNLLSHQAFFGFESDKFINTGLGFGAVPGCSLVKEMMDDYRDIPFIMENGMYDLVACPVRNTDVFLKHDLRRDGTMQVLRGDILILPQEYLSPIDQVTREIKCTENTISIHWFSGSWVTESQRKENKEQLKKIKRERMMEKMCALGRAILGNQAYEIIKNLIKGNCVE